MMAHKQLLHELLKEDQEPFHLKSYIADRRSQLNKSSPITTLQVKKCKPIAPETSTKRSNLRKHACFFSFHNSPDVRKSPFLDFQSPAMSPCKSPTGAVFLHIPSRTAALLVEAAMRIQNQQQSKPKAQIKNVGFGLFGSFLKILKDRSKNRNRAIGDNELKVSRNYESKVKGKLEGDIRISCSCNSSRLSRGDLDASTSTCWPEELDEINGDFALRETRFCSSPVSPFRFSLHKSPSSSGRRTPDFCSPVASPSRHVKQEKENYATREDSDNVHGAEEEKEQCSPVSVLDPFFEDDAHESIDAEEEDYDLDCSYANVQRAKQQLLYRLRRFEKLAELDPLELEQKLLESSDDEYQRESVESEDDEPLSLYRKQDADTFVNEVFSLSSLQHNSRKMSADMKRLVSDLIVEEKSKIFCLGNKEVVLGRTCNRLDSWREVEFDTIDTMVELDFKRGFDGWKKFPEQVEETAAEVELAIFGLLVEELSEELFYMDEQHQELNYVPTECT
ncbi:hypothetical protein Pfo_004156 [Paulownia fortunei]|nr:hypothetical protein Pfo_004156 [Paulownia fortunei]